MLLSSLITVAATIQLMTYRHLEPLTTNHYSLDVIWRAPLSIIDLCHFLFIDLDRTWSCVVLPLFTFQ